MIPFPVSKILSNFAPENSVDYWLLCLLTTLFYNIVFATPPPSLP